MRRLTRLGNTWRPIRSYKRLPCQGGRRSSILSLTSITSTFACYGDLLLKVDRIVVPETLRTTLLDCLHRAHNGVATLRFIILARYHK
jgi:hypothetical protein